MSLVAALAARPSRTFGDAAELFEAGATPSDIGRALQAKAPTAKRRGATKRAPVRGVAARRIRLTVPS